MILAWLSVAWAIECKEPVALDQLSLSLDAAEQSFIDFDDAAFRDRVNIISGVMLPCVGDPVPPALASRTHTILGLHFLAMGDEANAALSIKAARAVDPESSIDRRLFPEGHMAEEWWNDTELANKSRTVPEPRFGSIAFDGTHTRARRSELPQVFQIFDESGQARSTQYLAPRQPLPAYAAIPRQRNMLIGCSAGSAVGAVAMFAGSWAARGSLVRNAQDLTVSADTLDGKRSTMNGLAVGSAALFGVGAGCGAGAVAIGER